ncbi:hypothetical protein STCU_10072 [Strigomonas culicis]|uniref:Uncharacterized protein n=1 Tax=Strigomonas culicis TaxID=28005 RepID=S9TJM5_9TRYP|nr:hypothetical protein STCU_10072 [Strigomonas culicis]|eukprot:EPY18317.1 hypothetical protein STCU_10072 [Strigomonas culicis]
MLLFVEVTEQVYRDYVLLEYDKFAVFCRDQEPVWRKAARDLQLMNEARLNSTGNIYERFQFQELCFREKQLLYQESLDFLFSVKILEQDEKSTAHFKARDRRRRSIGTFAVPQPPGFAQEGLVTPNRGMQLDVTSSNGDSKADKGARGTSLHPMPPQAPQNTTNVRPAFMANEQVPAVKPSGDGGAATGHTPVNAPLQGSGRNPKSKQKEESKTLLTFFTKKVAA